MPIVAVGFGGARGRRLASLAFVGSVVTLIGVAPTSSAYPASSGQLRVSPLLLHRSPPPHFQVRGFLTLGSFPQFSSKLADLDKINLALRNAVRSDEATYAPEARKARHAVEAGGHAGTVGIYRVSANPPARISASTRIVSVLLPVGHVAYGGHTGVPGWIALTATVPDARKITLPSMFRDPGGGLRVFAKEWRLHLTNVQLRCVDGGLLWWITADGVSLS